jgi:hypothetical protein
MADLETKLDSLINSNSESRAFVLAVLENLEKDPEKINSLLNKLKTPAKSFSLVNRSSFQTVRTSVEFLINVARLGKGTPEDILKGYRVFRTDLPPLELGDREIWRGVVRHQVLCRKMACVTFMKKMERQHSLMTRTRLKCLASTIFPVLAYWRKSNLPHHQSLKIAWKICFEIVLLHHKFQNILLPLPTSPVAENGLDFLT